MFSHDVAHITTCLGRNLPDDSMPQFWTLGMKSYNANISPGFQMCNGFSSISNIIG